ncbi:MAG: Ribonuclease HII [Candidatus Peregrinibacteria bacterium GW2011_GWA2_47_7]|nr:MAG: Ribonuclease HII [Candidatus Peregrinibacteria bacterium GW2011_GWA2_47_7]
MCAAVILRDSAKIPGLADSKSLDSATLNRLFPKIVAQGIVSVSVVPAGLIDRRGLTEAVRIGFYQAVEGLSVRPEKLLIDGKDRFAFKIPFQTIIKGDETVPVISAASIVAKVVRDEMMLKIHRYFPQYGFEIHKGYGTELHFAMLREHGVSVVHRRICKPIWEKLHVQELVF